MKNLDTVTTDRTQINEELAEFPFELLALENPLETFIAEEVKATHPAEPDLFACHEGIPAHNQTLFEQARIVLIGGAV